ncbi:MAG TPA: hypothetical protein VJN92_11350 [Candidatus Acidoferrum sp.]|nr:hypothetical protein [Candidatus Acidoferrum sp.]
MNCWGSFSAFWSNGAMGMEELAGEIAEHRGAAGRDAALRVQKDEADEEFLDETDSRSLTYWPE